MKHQKDPSPLNSEEDMEMELPKPQTRSQVSLGSGRHAAESAFEVKEDSKDEEFCRIHARI